MKYVVICILKTAAYNMVQVFILQIWPNFGMPAQPQKGQKTYLVKEYQCQRTNPLHQDPTSLWTFCGSSQVLWGKPPGVAWHSSARLLQGRAWAFIPWVAPTPVNPTLWSFAGLCRKQLEAGSLPLQRSLGTWFNHQCQLSTNQNIS